LLCVSVSIHISFCGMTFHVIPSHESSGPFDFLDSLSLSLSLSLDSQNRFQYSNLLLSIMLGLTATS
jgi:hypothetical protein